MRLPDSPIDPPTSESGSIGSRIVLALNTLRFVSFSLMLHVVIIVLLGSAVIFQAVQNAPDFVAGSDGVLVDAVEQAPPPSEPDPSKSLSQFVPPTPDLPSMALPNLVTSAATSTFTVATIPTPQVPITDVSKVGSLGKGMADAAARAGIGSRIGGMARVSFFGMKTEAKRIAYLVDYSGSMSGPFRLTMEKELERSLKELPNGTQVLIIPWAGGAWLYDQLAEDIKDRWEMKGNYDNFALRKGAKFDKPQWVSITPQTVEKLMKGVLAQKAWPGGTDWRQPFNLAMQANPPPDTIFFMTDGQLADTKTALEDIDKLMKKSLPAPKVFSLWIKNKGYSSDTMKTLAQKYAGELREVGEKEKK